MSEPSDQQHGAVTVLAVDDQAVFRHTARELIAATDGFQQIAEAGSGEQALALAAELHPELVLVDVRMPGMDGIETARRLVDQEPSAVVVLVSLEAVVDLPADDRRGRRRRAHPQAGALTAGRCERSGARMGTGIRPATRGCRSRGVRPDAASRRSPRAGRACW